MVSDSFDDISCELTVRRRKTRPFMDGFQGGSSNIALRSSASPPTPVSLQFADALDIYR